MITIPGSADEINKINPNRIIERRMVQLCGILISPALIGSGKSEKTDSDLLVDSSGRPYIPGSSLAGALRHHISASEADTLFGPIFKDDSDSGGEDKADSNAKLSPLWVYDAKLSCSKMLSKAEIIELDGVKIDYDKKTSTSEGKYDFQAVERGSLVLIRLMLVIRENDRGKGLNESLDKLLNLMMDGRVAVGAKTSRGFGYFKTKMIYECPLIFEDDVVDSLNKWLRFNWSTLKKSDGWREYNPTELGRENQTEYSKLKVDLRLEGSIMIRSYCADETDENLVHEHINSAGKPCIYGTSWGGAIRNIAQKLLLDLGLSEVLCTCMLNDYFGFVDEKEKIMSASKIRIHMSTLEGEDGEIGYRKYTRVAINRCTGGAASGALFTVKPWFNGHTVLTLEWPKQCDDIGDLILLVMRDLNNGLIAIGGETSIGRGIFSIEKIELNGKSGFNIGEQQYTALAKRIHNLKKQNEV